MERNLCDFFFLPVQKGRNSMRHFIATASLSLSLLPRLLKIFFFSFSLSLYLTAPNIPPAPPPLFPYFLEEVSRKRRDFFLLFPPPDTVFAGAAATLFSSFLILMGCQIYWKEFVRIWCGSLSREIHHFFLRKSPCQCLNSFPAYKTVVGK